MSSRATRVLSLTIAVYLLSLPGCGVKIDTGPQTAEEATQSNQRRARSFRAEWTNRLLQLPPVERVVALVGFMDSISARYIDYGRTVSDEWREGNQGRGEAVPASEMRRMVDQWSKTQLPLVRSYEDVVEYGLELTFESREFDESFHKLIRAKVDHFYQIYSDVFHPSGDLSEYEQRLDRAVINLERLSRDVDDGLVRFR